MLMSQSRRYPFVVLASVIITGFLVVAVWHQERIITEFRFAASGLRGGSNKLSFYEIAKKYKTDKVNPHHYERMYSEKFEPIRNQKLKMLEIGLGCDQDYGPGASYYTWLAYFPHVDLYFIEYDGACAKKWANATSSAHIFIGDQTDTDFLNAFISATTSDGNLFDIIIDDGGHTMDQQRISFEALWGSVKPGGMYFVEDLATSYHEQWGGAWGYDLSFMEILKRIMDDISLRDMDGLGKPSPWYPISLEVLKIDFTQEVVAFTKMRGDEHDEAVYASGKVVGGDDPHEAVASGKVVVGR